MRTNLTVRILIGTFAVLLLAGLMLGMTIHKRVLNEFDIALEAKAKTFVMLTEREGQELEFEFSHEAMPEFKLGKNAEFFQAFLADGTVLVRSESLAGSDLGVMIPPRSRRDFRNLRLPDGRPGRAIQLSFWPRVEDEEDPDDDSSDSSDEEATLDEADDSTSDTVGEEDADDEEGAIISDLVITKSGDEIKILVPDGINAESLSIIVVMARGRQRLNAMLLSLHLTLAFTDLVILAFIGFLVRRAVRDGLQPIDQINEQLNRIGPEALDNRVSVVKPPEELQTILSALNGMLDRLERAFDRERRFSSNVAHELRTPVSELRTACEVGGKWPDDRESVQQFFADIHETALQMERIVSNLLTLSRCDNGTATVTLEDIQLELLIQQCLDRVTTDAEAKEVRFNLRVEPDAEVCTDREKLEIIVQNLIDNAVTYAIPGSVVNCAIDGTDSGFELVVENQAAEITRGDLENIFDRFWQKDPSRSGGDHVGLGLSIVKALCELLRINIHIELKDESTFQVRMAFT